MKSELKQKIGVFGLTMIVIGSCIGIGIFKTPSQTIEEIPHYGYALIPWLLGGFATFLGAMTFAELGARFPKTGGVYVYIREAFGPLFAFLYGWIILLIVNTGAIAALATAFTDYLVVITPLSGSYKVIISILIIVCLSLFNALGIGISNSLTSFLTILKLMAIFLIVCLAAYFLSKGSNTLSEGISTERPEGLFTSIMLAFVGVFFSFGGWHHATYLSGEVIGPTKTVPKAILIGTGSVLLIYILVILGYMSLLPVSEMAASKKVAADAVGKLFENGQMLVSIAVMISIFGTIAIYTMSAPRIYYSMAKDGAFFQSLAKVHPQYKTPFNAIIFQGLWACVLILIWESFNNLMTFVTFMDIVFMALATATIFTFRRKHSSRPSFFLKLYPIAPLFYLLITCTFVVTALFSLTMEAWIGVAILGLGVPSYFFFKKKNI